MRRATIAIRRVGVRDMPNAQQERCPRSCSSNCAVPDVSSAIDAC
jgi:hypothetical protein